MVTARTLKGAQVYVTFYPDCEENVGIIHTQNHFILQLWNFSFNKNFCSIMV